MEALDKGGRLLHYQQQQQEEHLRHRLQGHRGSYQAWKCVSFGCSLLAMLLLLSKCYEVSTDLNLLLGIDRLLRQQASANHSSTLSWPPVPIEQLLPDGAQESNSSFGMDSLESNHTMLMSHLQMSLGRQLRADQLLRQEVDAFMVEFQNAKSTLTLSALLVFIYLVSWLLMTLAVNETRLASNDTSLRNIILLSVFGAVDIAASVGFVMVRLIMYSVKNVSFARGMLDSNGLRESGIRLSADQLTAFTALRLIAMRSCSAYVDVYVSFVVALLTLLRLYAVLRALAYFRRLRRNRDHRHHNQHHNLKKQHQQIWSSFLGSSSSGPYGSATHLVSAGLDPVDFRSAPNADSATPVGRNGYHQLYRHSHSHNRRYPLPVHLLSPGQHQHHSPRAVMTDYEPASPTHQRTKTAPRYKVLQQQHHHTPSLTTQRNHHSSSTSKPLLTTSATTLTLPRQPCQAARPRAANHLPLLLLSRNKHASTNEPTDTTTRRNLSAPNLLVVKGRLAQRLAHAEQQQQVRQLHSDSAAEPVIKSRRLAKEEELQKCQDHQEQQQSEARKQQLSMEHLLGREVATEEPEKRQETYKILKEESKVLPKAAYRLIRTTGAVYTSTGSLSSSLSSSSSGVVPCEFSDDSSVLESSRSRLRSRSRSQPKSRAAGGNRLSEELVAPKVFQVVDAGGQNHNSISLAKYYYA